MTHEECITLLALTGRSIDAVVLLTGNFNVHAWGHLTRELNVETSYGVAAQLNSYTHATRFRAERVLAEALTMMEK